MKLEIEAGKEGVDLIFVDLDLEDGFNLPQKALFQCQESSWIGGNEVRIGAGEWLVPSEKEGVFRGEPMDDESRKKLIPGIIEAAKEQGYVF